MAKTNSMFAIFFKKNDTEAAFYIVQGSYMDKL